MRPSPLRLALLLAFVHPPSHAATVIENARIVDVASGALFDAAEVRIDGERIIGVGAAGAQEGVTSRIDARGNCLVPGELRTAGLPRTERI